MPAEASQEEQMALYWLDREVVNLPHIADALDKSGKLAKRDSSPVTTVPDHCCEGAAVQGVRTERNLGQRRQDVSGRWVPAVRRHICIRGMWCKRCRRRRLILRTRGCGDSQTLIKRGVRRWRVPMEFGVCSPFAGRSLLKVVLALLGR
jgi:hypothetical protein